MEIYLEPRTIDALSEQLETKQSCIGLLIGKPLSEAQLIIQDLLPLNLRPNIFSTHGLDKLVLKRQELQQFSENIELLLPQGLKTIGLWTYSQSPLKEDIEIEFLRLCQLLFYVDEEKPPDHSFGIVHFQYDQKGGFHINASHSPSFDLIQKAKLVIGGFPPAFSLRKLSTSLKFTHTIKPQKIQKVAQIFEQIRKSIKFKAQEQTLFFVRGQPLSQEGSSISLAQLSSQKQIKIQAFQKEQVKGMSQIQQNTELSLQWSGSYPIQLYIQGGASVKQVREEVIKRILQQFDEGVECSKESQGQPDAFQMDSGIISRVDYFNLYIPRTLHFKVRDTLYKDYLLPSEKEHSANQRLQKLFGINSVELIEKSEKEQLNPVQNESRQDQEKEGRKVDCLQNKGMLIGVGLGLVCLAWGLLFI